MYMYSQPDDGKRAEKGCTVAMIRVFDSLARQQVPLRNIGWLESDIYAV